MPAEHAKSVQLVHLNTHACLRSTRSQFSWFTLICLPSEHAKSVPLPLVHTNASASVVWVTCLSSLRLIHWNCTNILINFGICSSLFCVRVVACVAFQLQHRMFDEPVGEWALQHRMLDEPAWKWSQQHRMFDEPAWECALQHQNNVWWTSVGMCATTSK